MTSLIPILFNIKSHSVSVLHPFSSCHSIEGHPSCFPDLHLVFFSLKSCDENRFPLASIKISRGPMTPSQFTILSKCAAANVFFSYHGRSLYGRRELARRRTRGVVPTMVGALPPDEKSSFSSMVLARENSGMESAYINNPHQ